MKNTVTDTVFDFLYQLRNNIEEKIFKREGVADEPVTYSILTAREMEEHGRKIALSHEVVKEKSNDKLLDRLDENEEMLNKVRKLLLETLKDKRPITPAGHWLLDNFYLIKDQLTIGKRLLPKKYSYDLPKLGNENLVGLPRVYDLALEVIAHNEGRLDLVLLKRFIDGYQSETNLTMGEIWAVPIMLRMALIENIRRIAARIALDEVDKKLANSWADRIMEVAEKKPNEIVIVIADLAQSKVNISSSFVAEFYRNLQGKSATVGMALSWLEQQLQVMQTNGNEQIARENQKQSVDHITMKNSIESLRILKTTEWREFVESISVVNDILLQDVDGVFGQMSFSTRDAYRHVVEAIAKKTKLPEETVAEKAIALTRAEAEQGNDVRKHHVGYFLIDEGVEKLEKELGYKPDIWLRFKRYVSKNAFYFYSGAIVLPSIILACIAGLLIYNASQQAELMILTIVLGHIVISQLFFDLTGFLSVQLAGPRVLPDMDFSKQIPDDASTMITVPCLFTSLQSITKLIEALEVRYLANPQDNLYYSLLSDFADSDSEHQPGDDKLLVHAKALVDGLNNKYRRNGKDIFFIFHRPRLWNKQEGKWMGYERKRGKLSALNNLLRGKGADKFILVVGNYEDIGFIRYVITLDADTALPRGSAAMMIATMYHPLNHPVYSTTEDRVVKGYGILQPRAAISIPPSDSSLYKKINTTDAGLDPYTKAVSDVYQDVFAEGSFIGKGIYQLDIFETVLGNKFPDNRILSHDLIEGSYIRSGYMSNILVYEDFPPTFLADVKRNHRWVRGDVQIADWLLPLTPGPNGKWFKNQLTPLSKWKIADNLRRSVFAFSVIFFLLLAWFFSGLPWLATAIVGAVFFLPFFINILWALFHKSVDLALEAHLEKLGTDFLRGSFMLLLNIATLPYEAYYKTDALLKSVWRMVVSKKHLLEWTPSDSIKSETFSSIKEAYKRLWFPFLFSLVVLVMLFYWMPGSIPAALPFLVLWMSMPALIYFLDKPVVQKIEQLVEEDKPYLHRLARKTWAYYEDFVTAADNWLPPDNFQVQPKEKLAHRTSPTNIGLTLLANLAAADFGYIVTRELIQRSYDTLSSANNLQKYKGHLFNWYETNNKKPMLPLYISTVDSGNLAGHLLTLRQGLFMLSSKKIIVPEIFSGFRDTALALKESLDKEEIVPLTNFFEALEKILENPPKNLNAYLQALNTLNQLSGEMSLLIYGKWIGKLRLSIQAAVVEIHHFAPWVQFAQDYMGTPYEHFFDRNPEFFELSHYVEKFAGQYNGTAADIPEHLKNALATGERHAATLLEEARYCAGLCNEMANMDFDFLYDPQKYLLHIGYNVSENKADHSYYDLLASEIRLGIFVAIAQRKIPQKAWFALGRLLTNPGRFPALISWSGSMFEYLMPTIVMPGYEGTLLQQTLKNMVKAQIDYGNEKGVPWGISESGYNLFDASINYQYKAFGVPTIGLKRGLGNDLVIAPYATLMALMINPGAAARNLKRMQELGFESDYGFYEAIDYTPARVPRKADHAIVKSYMVHHLGMSFLSLAYALLDQPMQKRFEADPMLQATVLLLQEKVPPPTNFFTNEEVSNIPEIVTSTEDNPIRYFNTADTFVPEVDVLSNSRYGTLLSNAGGGYSKWKDISITRWRMDGTYDGYGFFCYMRDSESGRLWSNTFQPTQTKPLNYEVIFSQGQTEFKRKDPDFETKTVVVISPEHDVEIRRVEITNRSKVVKTIEITSYAEIVLNKQDADESHPAFSNLFVQSKIVPEEKAIICNRRPRSKKDTAPWMFHTLKCNSFDPLSTSYETDRMKFVGRTGNMAAPQAVLTDAPLSNTEGPVLDPVVAIKRIIKIEPGQSLELYLIMGVAENEAECRNLLTSYRNLNNINRTFEVSWTHGQVLLRQINATETEAQLYNSMVGSLVYGNKAMRASDEIIKSNTLGQPGLWPFSISGDIPIVLLKVHHSDNFEIVKQMIKAHSYWHLKGVEADLVILNEDPGLYRHSFQDQIIDYNNTVTSVYDVEKKGRIFVLSLEQVNNINRTLLQAAAQLVIDDLEGPLQKQVYKTSILPEPVRLNAPSFLLANQLFQSRELLLPQNLLFFNGTGGFSENGKEYKIITSSTQKTPAPWCNVLANEKFGSVISESGSSYTWCVNAHEYRLTPWLNDPVKDECGEAFYIRDESSGFFWSPMPLPATGKGNYITTHGFGYSVFEHVEQGIYSETTVFTDLEDSIRFHVIKLKNETEVARTLSLSAYMEWVLGDEPGNQRRHVITQQHFETKSLWATNRYNTVFAKRVSFLDCDIEDYTYTCLRKEFIGRNRTLQSPAAMTLKKLSNSSGAGFDPCAAILFELTLAAGEEKEVVFRLGSAKDEYEAHRKIEQFQGLPVAHESLEKVKTYWKQALGSIRVKTPDTALNIMANGWLVYQTLASRIWARSGYYQSGGAYGFRDQLQDVMAMIHAQPTVAQKQILLAASRQFREGDVQHWWHPPVGKGVRTTCSDDYLWLPFVTAQYIMITGDTAILDKKVPFIEGRSLLPEEDSYYDLAIVSQHTESLYNHCIAAIRYGLKFGAHGLPLIGSGDWNDGMDKVGEHGKGESVWLGFFLYETLQRFYVVARLNDDEPFAAECLQHAKDLRKNLNENGWDGEWFRRAYFDDGTPLGSKENEECKIDSISQSWSVISGAGLPERQAQAMASLDKHLVDRKFGIIKLLEPAFDKSDLNPGYIKGYVPGVRENGGQYTHAAIWTLMAFAKLGQNEKVWELFNYINPVNHGTNAESIQTYKVEPYVIAADVYGVSPHEGRGGWTWYTGSAGWTYQFILQSLLGLNRHADKLQLNPVIPEAWPNFEIRYRYGITFYTIRVNNSRKGNIIYKLDGNLIENDYVTLVNDKMDHTIDVEI